jgi:hypothetical protein
MFTIAGYGGANFPAAIGRRSRHCYANPIDSIGDYDHSVGTQVLLKVKMRGVGRALKTWVPIVEAASPVAQRFLGCTK